jgi:KaiC/GvpD/RAD55 family RecA-like ATPase
VERIKSGIIGLDKHIGGGFEKGSLIEVAGGEGTFKSTFALHFAIQGIKNNEKVTYISLEEPKESFEKTAKSLGVEKEFEKVDFRNIDIKDVIQQAKFFNISSVGAEEIAQKIIKLVDNPHRLIFDTATTLALYSSRTQIKLKGNKNWDFVKPSAGDIRVMLYYLANELRKKNDCTSLLLAETGSGELYLPEKVLKYISDAKIELKKSSLGTRTPRSLQILKMRHTNHSLDEQPISLTKKGLKVESIEE